METIRLLGVPFSSNTLLSSQDYNFQRANMRHAGIHIVNYGQTIFG